MDSATFRTNFPEFSSSTTYPDTVVNYWLGIGSKMLRPEAWDELLDHGLELFTAHHITLARQNAKAAAKGGVSGANSGPQSSKSVDRVSASYDTHSSSIEGAGHWNLTTYGTQFIQLVKMVGIGGAVAFGNGEASGVGLSQWFGGTP